MEKAQRKGIDIIIPIYNAYEDLNKCIDSIKKYTDLELDRLVLINDKSPDERIKTYLDSLKSENIVVIHNENNMGFSNNVNKGMQLSEDRDVLLLNSDTVVTSNWVNKIYDCAYSDSTIGTVTPLSNSATLCSLPIMCQDNNIPEGLSVDDLAKMVEKYSVRAYPRITVAVGFCMFIKREVIKLVGYFDAETFEKGYGEENDFCNRTEQYGYYHVMCDDTFIYHKGTVSFKSEEKLKLIEEHDKILNERYPEQMKNNSLYCMSNPDQYIRDNLNIHIDLSNGKKNILYLLHLDFRSDAKKDTYSNIGGTQFHVKDLTETLKDKYNIFVVSRDMEYLHLSVYIEEKVYSYRFYIGKPPLFLKFRDDKLKKLFDSILDCFKINIVHIHHVDGLSLDMYYSAAERNIPLIQTVHDYYSISPSYKLLDADNKYIELDCKDEDRWKKSVKKYGGYSESVDILNKWQKEFVDAYSLCDKIVYPHEVTRDITLSYYPKLSDKSIVINHGTDIKTKGEKWILASEIIVDNEVDGKIDLCETVGCQGIKIIGWAFIRNVDCFNIKYYIVTDSKDDRLCIQEMSQYERTDVSGTFENEKYILSGFRTMKCLSDNVKDCSVLLEYEGKYYSSEKLKSKFQKENRTNKINVAFLGGMVPEKGSELAYNMIKSAPVDEFEWFSIGIIGDSNYNELEQENFHKTGAYTKEELNDIIKSHGIDIICILSIWPETFCYTLSESIICNTPVLVTDIGAHGYRVKENGYGWVVDYKSTGEQIVEKLRNIYNDKTDFERVKKIAEEYKEKSVREMCDEYDALYDSIDITGIVYNDSFDNRVILSAMEIDGDYIWSSNGNFNAVITENKKIKSELYKADAELMLARQDSINLRASKSYRFGRKIAKIFKR